MNVTKVFLVLCLAFAVSEGFFLKKKLKKILLAKALIKGPILAIGAASAAKAIKAKAALPIGVGIGAGATALLGQSSAAPAPAPHPKPVAYYPSASAPSAPVEHPHSEGYVYSAPVQHNAEPAAPQHTYGVPEQQQSWGQVAPPAQSVQYYESPHAHGYSSFSGAAAPQNTYGAPSHSLSQDSYPQHSW